MTLNQEELLKLCIDLISCKSITPINDGAIELIKIKLSSLGFTTYKLVFDDTTNLYARIGNKPPNLCFAGHTDVVPPGDLNLWKTPPFTPKILNNILYGRGVVDMKAAICAFIIATESYLSINKNINGSISFIITGDEEASGKNGTIKILEWLKQKKEKIDACIVGEPTSHTRVGDTIKIGRRGSLTCKLTINGQQGHVAYPDLAINPITQLIKILYILKHNKLDAGNKFFQPSNLEVTTINVDNPAGNVIPENAYSQFNIRFNNEQSAECLKQYIQSTISSITNNYILDMHISAYPFITEPNTLSDIMIRSIKQEVDYTPKLSTGGGTSDARYIKNICPVVEVGLLNATAHQINESSSVDDIYLLSKVYFNFLDNFFA